MCSHEQKNRWRKLLARLKTVGPRIRQRLLRVRSVQVGALYYGLFNGYGTIAVHLQFSSTRFRSQIEAKLGKAGWEIEDSSGWETARRLDLVRVGPRLMGSYTRQKTLGSLMTVSKWSGRE